MSKNLAALEIYLIKHELAASRAPSFCCLQDFVLVMNLGYVLRPSNPATMRPILLHLSGRGLSAAILLRVFNCVPMTPASIHAITDRLAGQAST